MQRIPVESSHIVSIGYDPKTRVLEIEFKENRVYQYFDVEPRVYELFLKADSYGEYFYAHINKHYRYDRVNEEKAPVPQTLALVTSNKDKFRDAQAVLGEFGIELEQLDLLVDAMQGFDTEKIAVRKAKEAYRLAGRPVVVQDTFWNILALRGFPGAYMRYVTEWLRAEDFLALMADKADRTVIRTHTVVYYDGKRSKVFAKDFYGTIAKEPRGKSRYSIDTIVINAGETKTLAEIREGSGVSSTDPKGSAWYEFAKWYNMQRKLGKV